MTCPVCESNEGRERISPGPTIFEGEHWVVEHAYPTSLLGWMVIVLKRHAESLHELSRAEGVELGLLQWAVARAQKVQTGCLKSYSVFFAEAADFAHTHVHMVPRAVDLSPELRGGKVFAYLKAAPDDVLPREQVAEFCTRVSNDVERALAGDDAPMAREG